MHEEGDVGRTLLRVLLVLLVLIAGVVWPAAAAVETVGQSVRTTADHARRLVGQILADELSSRAGTAGRLELQKLYEAISAGHLLLAERLRLRGDTLQGGSTRFSERHRVATARYEAAVSRTLAGFARVAALPQIDKTALEELHAALVGLAPPQRPAIHGVLPYNQPSFLPRPPVTAPQVTPAYRMAELAEPAAADLAGTPEAPVSPLIMAQARAIASATGRSHWDPAAIYNWVRDNVRTEWYWGSMKGAEETLRQKSGNDADQAALLVALLRASGYPARYVRGVAEFFPGLDAARSATGISDPDQILTFFQAAGIPCDAVRDGSRIINLRIEHLWVETFVPYANYRGMEADATGKLWIPLDTSFKTGGFDEPATLDLATVAGNPLPGFRDRYLATAQAETPLEMLRRETGQFLQASHPGSLYADVLHIRRQRSAPLGILPATLQFVDVAVTAEYTALPPEMQHQVRLRATTGDTASQPLFDLTLPLRELSNRQVLIGFEPETVEDQEQINRWGGLDNIPAYLVRLKPTVVVSGERRVVAASGLAAGAEFDLAVDFSAPAGTLSVSDTVVTGYPLLLGIVAQEALPPDRETLAETAPDRLYRAAQAYVDAWNRSESELAELFNLALARPLPSFVVVGGLLQVEQLAGLPHAVHWQGLFLDANLRTVAAVARAGADAERVRHFSQLSALEGSVQEHRLFEEEFGVTAMSTAKLIGLAQSSGTLLLTLDEANANALLPSLDLDDHVAADIIDAVSKGETVHMPAERVQLSDWSGVGYLRENRLTGEAGYMLSGGLAGGQTVLGRRDWPEELAAIMARPFSGEPNRDPAEAFSLAAVTPWAIREATAGEPLAGTLMVLVRDAQGRAVAGASVTFSVRIGGGWLIDDLLSPGVQLQELTVVSGSDGIARTGFVPGTDTSANPVVYVRAGDQHANLVGENLIDARLASGTLAKLATPIAIFGFAGRPDPLLSKAYGDDLRGVVFSYSGDVLLMLRDRFGNPVANQAVTFAGGPVEPVAGSHCQNPPGLTEWQRNAQLAGDEDCLRRLPVHGECDATASITVFSRSDGGARAGVILGGVPTARYPVTATFTTHAGTANATWSHRSDSFASCLTGIAPPEHRLIMNYRQRLDEAGRNVDARPAGNSAELQVKAWLLAETETVVPGGQTLSCAPLPNLYCAMVAGTGAFTSASPTRVTVAGKPAARVATMANSQVLPYLYRADVVLPLGLADIAVEAEAARTMQRIVNSCSGCGPLEPAATVVVGPERCTVPIWGVDLQIPAAVSVLVDSRGITRQDLRVEFSIRPAEYVANFAQLLLYRNGELWDTLPAGISGLSAAVFPAGYWFDPRATYELQVLINNPGDVNEIRSRKIPLLQRTAAVDLRVDSLPDTVEDQVGAFVLLNNDFDEQEADPAVTFPDAATDALIETDDELKRAWLQIDDSTGQGGSWQVRASDPSKLRIYHQKDGAWVEIRPTDPPEPVTGFPAVIPLYLEGLAESTAVRGDVLTATFFPANAAAVSDTVPVTTLDLDMAVDGNRDRVIDFRYGHDERALFWVNNDRDVIKFDWDDMRNVEDDTDNLDDGDSDSTDAKISCKRDLEDFARLHILLGRMGSSGQLTFTLRVAADDEKIQPMLNVFPAVNRSDGYLGLPSDEATPEQPDEQTGMRLAAASGKLPVTLPASVLTVIGGNPFLFEGRKPGKGRLVLTASHQGVPVATRNIELTLFEPSWFYDHFVVSQADVTNDGSVNPFVNPEGMTANASRLGLYRPESDEYVLFVHGWNMQPWEKRRWAETVFKRLWWQGYKGKVGLFDWPCNTFTLIPGPTNYDRSEFKAWQAAEALKKTLEALSANHAGEIRLLAHSQGNVVAGEALRLGEAGLVHTYVASQAALSASFYEGTLDSIAPVLPVFAYETPDILSAYPADPSHGPYMSQVREKGTWLVSYFNVDDYALVKAGELTPGWEYNNRTRPDDSVGYDYDGNPASYPPAEPSRGFYRDFTYVDDIRDYRLLTLPADRYEIFSLAAESRSKALGAVRSLSVFEPLAVSFEEIGSRDLAASFSFDDLHYSHSRQFRSNVVAELGYWRAFAKDSGLQTIWSYR